VGGDEVLEDGEALAEVGDDRLLHDLARGLGHGAAHAGQLPHLLLGASGAGVGHHVDRVELAAAHAVGGLHLLEHLFGDGLGGAVPGVDDLVVALTVGDGAFLPLPLDLERFLAGLGDDVGLLGGDAHVVDADRDAGARRHVEADFLDDVEDLDGALQAQVDEAVVDEILQALLLQRAVDERQVVGEVGAQQHAADRGLDAGRLAVDRLGVDDVLVVEDLLPRAGAPGFTHFATATRRLTHTLRHTLHFECAQHTPHKTGTGRRQHYDARYDLFSPGP